jgi:lipoprotein signal peptidase
MGVTFFGVEAARHRMLATTPFAVQLSQHLTGRKSVATLFVVCALLRAYQYLRPSSYVCATGFGLFLGGALANLSEQYLGHGVADYIPVAGNLLG